ncbi:dipeptide ABC transporter ATP-binding protein [Polaromonas sp. JS666]|uniref:dipeptide ABC transporter ATP-binding protein n=1 Tax=Polaromonas sp. (strain JS666 / ATCC BAA-500) TaxID=296591 RepID=UPI0000464891|nr:dipeptide ABC transporter ATP-binding protein [Polaromonas sp. JS666]ABE46278.1 Oligopeptide/dipeptide ABC transporter, ATP-binding protein-like protein [Polaromonas sp. JS666]
MNADLVARVQNLSVAFCGDVGAPMAVRDVSFEVARGKTLAIVGESGSGKSVTSLAIMRLVELGGGRIASGQMQLRTRHHGVVDLMEAPESQLRRLRGADMAMIFQEPMTSLNPVFKVGDQILEAIRLHQPGDRAATLARALRMLDLVRIPDAKQVMGRYPHQLSGGMRQRIMIAMALACEPTLLIADEPTTALDVTVQSQILQIIRGLQDDLDMGVVFITHDMGVVAEIADEVMVMRNGETVERGSVGRIFARPQHPYTRSLLAAVPRLGAMQGTDFPAKFPLVEPGTGEVVQAVAPSGSPLDAPTPDYNLPPLLRVRNLVTRYDLRGGILGRVQRRVHAVEDVSFDLFAGETLALVGESGCGKSTTARAVARLLHTQGGQIEFNGQSIGTMTGSRLKGLRREVQMVFQDPYASLDPRRTIEDSLLEPLKVHNIAYGEEARRRAGELLCKVGLLPQHAHRYPHEFSGGQRQRICIARALALSPRLIVADESVSALDVSIQAQVINLMQDLQRELGIAFLFISHDLAVVERVSHRVAVMYLGRIVEIGTRRQIFENPRHPYTRKLLSAVPVADPQRRNLRHMMAGEIPSPIHGLHYAPPELRLDEIAPGHFVVHDALMAA